jgi:hypothetical protein
MFHYPTTNSLIKRAVVFTLSLFLALPLFADEKVPTLSMGMVPYLPPHQLYQLLKPSADDLTRHSDVKITVNVYITCLSINPMPVSRLPS